MASPAPSAWVPGCAAAPQPRRLTPGARRVLATLAGQQTPLAARQLHAQLRGCGARIGLTTVYRALRALADAGLVHEFRRHEEATFRACSPTEHMHLICAHCGTVREHRPARLSEALADVRAAGFRISSSRIEVYGLCGNCTPPDSAAT